MVLIFIDESGSVDLTDHIKIYLLNAVLIQETAFQNFDLNMISMKEELTYKYNLPNSDFELHASDLFSNEKGFRSLGKKLQLIDCLDLFSSVIQCMCSNSEFEIIVTAILKDELGGEFNIKYWAYSMLLERIEYSLGQNYDTKGILLRDTEGITKDIKTKELIKDILYRGTKYVKFQNIIPSMYFLDSKMSEGIQLSDFSGYNIRRFLETVLYNEHNRNITTRPLFETYLSKKLRGYPDYKGKGMKIFPDIDIL